MEETKNKDVKTMKFRKGVHGNFNDDLSKNDLIKINSKIKDLQIITLKGYCNRKYLNSFYLLDFYKFI